MRTLATRKSYEYYYTRYMNPIVDTSKDALALDHSQVFIIAAVETPTEYLAYYGGQSAVTITTGGRTYTNTDQVFLAYLPKSNNVRDGWQKYLGTDGKPKPLFQPSLSGWDSLQVWIRAMLYENGVYYGWYIGEANPDHIHKLGLTTSTDGINWTRYSTQPIYSDPTLTNGRLISFKILNDNGVYRMLYTGEDPHITGLFMATSPDKVNWTKQPFNKFSGEGYGFISEFLKINGKYYIWIQKQLRGSNGLGPAEGINLFSTTDFVNFVDLGQQIKWKGASEQGIGVDINFFKKPNGSYFMLHNAPKNHIEVAANGGEQFSCFKVAELNRADLPIATNANKYAYPSYVKRHYPLNDEHYFNLKFKEVIKGEEGTINSTPTFGALEYWSANGSQVITFPNDGTIINSSNFGVKFRCEVKTTGTHELFRIGNDILVTLESGKLRVRLSSDGVTYQKDYISTTNVSTPAGITYADTIPHIWVGFYFNSGTLKLYNDFVEFTTTKTVDSALASVRSSTSDILIGQNATIQLRSYSVLGAHTSQQFIDLDI